LKLEDSKSSEILHHAGWYIFTSILEKHSASISSQSQAVKETAIVAYLKEASF
jgi:hypothetical protein